MNNDAVITYFPVGNGDTSLIHLSDKTDIIIDCNITQASGDEEDKTRYDVHDHLLKELKKLEGKTPHVDTFILTHPDQDHCRGFSEVFYSGAPAKYSSEDKKEGRILIDELWFTPRIFSKAEELCDDALTFKKEADRRMLLYTERSASSNQPGNRLRIIGSSELEEVVGLKEIVSNPGETLNRINGSNKDDFSFFIHAPFKEDTDSKYKERNLTSVVLQARFDMPNQERAVLAFFGGDAGCEVWENILNRSDDDTLEWDLFMAPHHCSWSYFSREAYKDNKIPSEKCIELLNKKREGAIIVASCKPIRDDDDNPPHYAAYEEYVDVVGKEKFFETMKNPNDPLMFRVTDKGPQKIEGATSSVIASSAAIRSAVGSPQTYG